MEQKYGNPFTVYNRKFIGILRVIIFINEITMCCAQPEPDSKASALFLQKKATAKVVA